jgi:hypothetical protein
MFHKDRSEISVKGEDAVLLSPLNVGLLVLSDTLLKEISLSLERDHVHPFERILDVVKFGNTDGEE